MSKAPYLTLVTSNYTPTRKQVTKFIVVDGGLTYVKFGQVLTIKQAKQLQTDSQNVAEEFKAKIIPYNSAVHKLLLKAQSFPNTLQSFAV